MEIAQITSHFTIADTVKLEVPNKASLQEPTDLTDAEADDIIKKYIDAQLKQHGIKAFNMQLTVKVKVIDKI